MAAPGGHLVGSVAGPDLAHCALVDGGVEDVAESKGGGAIDPVREQGDAPFDERDAPFDEPGPSSLPARLMPPPRAVTPEHEDEGLLSEQHDSFDFSDPNAIGASRPLFGRVKSLKSIDFDGVGRQRTFASHLTDETRKIANLNSRSANNGSMSRLDAESAMLGSMSHGSDNFAPFGADGSVPPTTGPWYDPQLQSAGSRNPVGPIKLRGLPHLPVTPPRQATRSNSPRSRNNAREGTGRKYFKTPDDAGREPKGNYERGTQIKEKVTLEREESLSMSDGDGVSALSGIGNDSLEGNGKQRGRMGGLDEKRNKEKHHGGLQNGDNSRLVRTTVGHD